MAERSKFFVSVLPTAIATLFGGLAGIAGAAFFSTATPAPRSDSGHLPERPVIPPERRRSADDVDGRLRRVERELVTRQDAAPQQTDFGLEGAPAKIEVARTADPATLDIATQIAMEEELWSDRLDAFDNEPIDEQRARSMSASVTADYDALIKGNNGNVRELACKTHQCKMEIEWGSNADMRKGSDGTLYARTTMSEGCARHVQRHEEAMRSTVIFECGDKHGLD